MQELDPSISSRTIALASILESGYRHLPTNSISSDGRLNWLEGTLLLAACVLLGFAFYFHPVIDGMG